MPIWSKSEMETFYADGSEVHESEVRIVGDEIAVSYKDDDGYVTYEGRAVSPGHFVLKCSVRSGTATLHQPPGGPHLDGYWVEAGHHGMWRLTLDDGAED